MIMIKVTNKENQVLQQHGASSWGSGKVEEEKIFEKSFGE